MASGSGVKQNALSQYGANSSTAAGALSTVSPIYAQMASGADGLTPQQKNNMRTSSLQQLGGGQAAAVGQGDLEAARTGNVGGYQYGLDDAARQSGVQQSQTELGIQNQDASVARQNQAVGLGGLSGIYSDANGQANANLSTANQAKPSFWQQLALQGVQAAGQAAGRL